MSLRKNVLINFILTASTILFPLVTFPYVTRTLSSENIGRIFYVDAFTQYFVLFSSIGIPFYGVREIAKLRNNPPERSNLVIELVILQLFLALLFSAVFFILSIFLPSLGYDIKLVRIGCVTIVASAFSVEWFYQGMENFSYITFRSLIIKFASVIAILFFVKGENDYNIYYLILALLVVTNATLNFGNFLRKFFIRFNIAHLNLKPHIKPLLLLFSINVSVSVYTVLDTIILGLLTDPKNVSYYNVPLRLVKMFWLVVGGVGTVLIPRMSSLFKNNDTVSIQNLMTKSFNVVFLLTIPFCFFCIIFPIEILQTISGQKYLYAENALRILSAIPLIIGVCNVAGTQFLLPIGKENKILHATIVGLILSLSLNFLLIPWLKFIGTSIACFAAELSVCIYIVIAAKRQIKFQIDYKLLIHISVAILLCFAGVFFLKIYLHNILLLASVFCMYIFLFLILQIFVFKNQFIYSLIKYKR